MTVRAGSPSARALDAVRRQDFATASAVIGDLIHGVFGLSVQAVDISRDGYSLNSVNGLVHLTTGHEYFFKFHHEEGEELTLEEYYRGELLKEAGFPVDLPRLVSRSVGSQILLYERRTAERLADVCERLESPCQPAFTARAATLPATTAPAEAVPATTALAAAARATTALSVRSTSGDAASVLRAQTKLDVLARGIYLRTLHAAPAAQAAAEPIHRLFHHRLIDPGHPDELGGRARRFFWNRRFELGGVVVPADELRSLRWVVNGVSYRDTIEALLGRSRVLLEPRRLSRFGAVTAHGDAHNANVWWEPGIGASGELILFDPAFAGRHVCALLAEVKATFHNVFAHPLWLYQAACATERYRVVVRRTAGFLEIDSDWRLSPLRESFLATKARDLWRPLLQTLDRRGWLADDWRATLRCALFCCPALVMDLCAGGSGGHTPDSSAIGLGVAVMMGSEPASGQHDAMTDFLDAIAP
jgi:hypothetical protein